MKRIMTMTTIAFIIAVWMSLPAFAAKIDTFKISINQDTKEVQISGTIDSGADRQVTVRITEPNGNLDYIGQTTSGESGAFTFQFTLTHETKGLYFVEFGGEGVEEKQYAAINYHGPLPMEVTLEAVFSVGGKQNAEQLVANQMLHADVVVTNVRDRVRDAVVVVGLFDANDDLYDFAYAPVTLDANGGTAQFQGGFKLPADVDGYYVKAFVMYFMHGHQFFDGPIIPFTEVHLPSFHRGN